MAKPPKPGGTPGTPSLPGGNVSNAQQSLKTHTTAGKPGNGGGKPGNKPGNQQKPPKPPPPPKPTAPPKPEDIHHSDKSKEHILEGDGGSQGGHLAGTGFSQKTEFPPTWKEPKILDAAYQVTQQGPPVDGPKMSKDANGNPVWVYNYEGVVDGVKIKTTVMSNGEIRTAYPPEGVGQHPDVITNPSAPNPAPKGVPMGNPPRYSHPDLGGNGDWTWEGPKGNRIIRVVQDDQGNVTTTDLGPYQKKK